MLLGEELQIDETNSNFEGGGKARFNRDFAFFDVQVHTYTNECASK